MIELKLVTIFIFDYNKEKEELLKYWLDALEVDYIAMGNLFISEDYVWSLFLGHLVIEKLLKALTLLNDCEFIPKIHDLNKLAKAAGLEINDEQKNLFDIITSFNIEARYPDYKKEFYKQCDTYFTNAHIEKIRETRLWLLDQLKR